MPYGGAVINLNGFDKTVDVIRTNQGDFTFHEILTYGNNAPFYKQAIVDSQFEAKNREHQKRPR